MGESEEIACNLLYASGIAAFSLALTLIPRWLPAQISSSSGRPLSKSGPTATVAPPKEIPKPWRTIGTGIIENLEFSPDGRWLYTSVAPSWRNPEDGGQAAVFDARTWRVEHRFRRQEYIVLSRSGRLIVTLGSDRDPLGNRSITVVRTNRRPRKQRMAIKGHSVWISIDEQNLGISKRIGSESEWNDRAEVWETQSGHRTGILREGDSAERYLGGWRASFDLGRRPGSYELPRSIKDLQTGKPLADRSDFGEVAECHATADTPHPSTCKETSASYRCGTFAKEI